MHEDMLKSLLIWGMETKTTIIYSTTQPETWLKFKRLAIPNIGECRINGTLISCKFECKIVKPFGK